MAREEKALTTAFQSSVFVTEFNAFRQIFSSDGSKKKKKKQQFIGEIEILASKHSAEELRDSVEAMVTKSLSGWAWEICRPIRSIVTTLKGYAGIVDTMASADPMPTCLIWGALKLVIECIGKYYEQFDRIQSELDRLPYLLLDLSNFEDLYSTAFNAHESFQHIMSKTYQNILWFLYHCTKTLKQPVLKVLRHDSKLSMLIADLQTNRSDLAALRSAAEGKLNQSMRDTIASEAKLDEDMRWEMKGEFIKTETERDQAQKFRLDDMEEKERGKWSDLINQLDGQNDFNFSLRDTMLQERHPETCQWLFAHAKFIAWTAKRTDTPILWLNGKHGAGKSFLCASVIEALERRAEPKLNSLPVVFQFLRKDIYVSRNQLLRNLACHLVHHLSKRPIAFPTSLVPFLKTVKNDSSSIEKLIRVVLQELSFTFILIDGLDEAEFTKEQAPAYINTKVSEVEAFMSFLMRCTIGNPDTIRLWCSSQPSHDWQTFFCHGDWKDSIIQHSLGLQDTDNDIRRYLNAGVADAIVDKVDNTFASLMLNTAMATEVEGSFLWASSMLQDLKDRAEDADDVVDLVRDGLPSTMSDFYTIVIDRIKLRDRGDKVLPLWKIVLSLLTFAKRALKVSEIIEAVAMIRTPKGHDLSRNKIVDVGKILKTCLSLVRIVKTSETSDADGSLVLSHSALAMFLRKRSDDVETPLADAEQLVSSKIHRDCCIRYLMQPRFSRVFKPEGTSWTQTDVCKLLKSHRLVLYAAKYWLCYYDRLPENDEKSVDMIRFLKSPNFYTCIQIQSLFIEGHFLQSIDPVTDRARSARRNLPEWLKLQHPTLYRQYLDFLTEWCEVLQLGLSAPFNGEMDRCLWGALGASNFLSKNECRYASYQLHDTTISHGLSKLHRVQLVSGDGMRLKMCALHIMSDKTEMMLEDWLIDGIRPPTRLVQTCVPLAMETDDVNVYASPCSTTSPMIPSSSYIGAPDLVALYSDACVIRVGSKLFDHGSKYMSLLSKLFKQNAGPWEDIQIVGNFLVISRRRTRRKALSDIALAREQRRIRLMKSRMKAFQESARNDRRHRSSSSSNSIEQGMIREMRTMRKKLAIHLPRGSSIEQTSSDDEDNNSRIHELSDADSDADSLESAAISSSDGSVSSDQVHLSSAEESWSEGSTDIEDLSDSISSNPGSRYPGSDDEDTHDETDDHSQAAATSDDPDSVSLDSLGSGIFSPEQSDSDSLDSTASFGRSIKESDMSDSDVESIASDMSFLDSKPGDGASSTNYQVRIVNQNVSVTCATCNKSIQRWLHCIQCNDKSFVICHKCQRRGRWCFHQAHSLYDMVKGKAIGVRSRNKNFQLRQELNVYRLDTDSTLPIFHVRKKYDAMLYGSAPAIHPNHPLIVWPITGSQLLFGDLAANQFFEQKLKIISKKARPICVDLSFSPCGQQLRVATIDATVQKPNRKSKAGVGESSADSTILLNLHLLILQLSSSKPAKIPPKHNASASQCLGYCTSKLIQTLPFAFCWGNSDLHLTISDSRLRVYRITFPGAPDAVDAARVTCNGSLHLPLDSNLSPLCKEIRILSPLSTIFLPRSARMRSVKFFPPAKAGANSIVIIGPQNCGPSESSQSSTICLYLSDADLGGWAVPSSIVEGLSEDAGQRLEGHFEHWDEEQDCDIIPFYY